MQGQFQTCNINFAREFDIGFVDDKLDIYQGKFCYRVDSTGAASCIDHFAVSSTLWNSLKHVSIEDSSANLSDHCSVILEITTICYSKWS